jgi:hypothetical protein
MIWIEIRPDAQYNLHFVNPADREKYALLLVDVILISIWSSIVRSSTYSNFCFLYFDLHTPQFQSEHSLYMIAQYGNVVDLSIPLVVGMCARPLRAGV